MEPRPDPQPPEDRGIGRIIEMQRTVLAWLETQAEEAPDYDLEQALTHAAITDMFLKRSGNKHALDY